MKKFIVLSIVLLMLAGFAITSSAVDLVVGRELITVGTLTVAVVSGNLEVTYDITEPGWELIETHLYVGKTNPEVDLNSAPGQFPYSEEHDPAVLTVTYIIPISGIDSYSLKGGKKWVADDDSGIGAEDKIYIAAHAEIGMVDGDGEPVLDNLDPLIDEQIEETTWAEGIQIREGKNWAMYFEFLEE